MNRVDRNLRKLKFLERHQCMFCLLTNCFHRLFIRIIVLILHLNLIIFSFLSIKLAAQQQMESKLACGSVPSVANLLCEKF